MRGYSLPGTSANPSLETATIHFSIWRTGWDSNPRMLSHRRFSRPLPSSSRQPVPWGHVPDSHRVAGIPRNVNPFQGGHYPALPSMSCSPAPHMPNLELNQYLLLLLNLTDPTGLFRAFRAASCSAHRIATAFMPPKPASFVRGFAATFRLVCRGVRLPRSS